MNHLPTDIARLVSSSFGGRPFYFGIWKNGANYQNFRHGISNFDQVKSTINSLWIDSVSKGKNRRFSGEFTVQEGKSTEVFSYQAWKFDLSIPETEGLLLFFDLPSVKNQIIEDDQTLPWLEFFKNYPLNQLSQTRENEVSILKSILDNSSEMIVLIDPDHKVLESNQLAKDLLFQYFNAVLQTGDDYRDFVLPHLQELYLKGFNSAIGGQPFLVEHNTATDSISFWFEYYVFPLYNPAKNLIGVCLRARDITIQKNAEQELRTLAETFNALNENLNESVVILSPDWKVIQFNTFGKERLRKNWGKEIQKGDDFREVLPSEYEMDFNKNFELAKNGILSEVENSVTGLGGVKIWIQSRFIPIFSNDKTILGVGILVKNIHEHKMLELNLQKSEEKFRKIVSSAAMAILIIDFEMKVTTINPEVTNVFGYTESEIVGQSIQKLIPARFHDIHVQHELDYVRSPRPIHMSDNRNVKAVKKNGEEIDIEISLNSFHLGENVFFLAMILDVTEKSKLTRLLQSASEVALLGNWEYTESPTGESNLYWSPMVRKIMEVPDDYKPVYSDLENFIEKESFENLRIQVQKSVETGVGYDVELEVKTYKGNQKFVRAIGLIEKSEEKRIKRFGTFQDITSKKETELSLIKSLQSINNYKKALDKSSFVMVISLDGIVIEVNESWCDLTEYSREELIGSNSDITRSDYHEATFFRVLWDTIQAGKIWKGEIKALKKSGQFFWVNTTIVPMKNENGEVFQFIAIGSDNTEKKHAVEELEVRAKELARSNAELEQFAFVASHDLQEPLRMVTSFLTLLRRKYQDKLDESGVKYIDFAVDGALKMRSTILDLLEFSRVGKDEEERKAWDLHKIIDEVRILQKKSIEKSKAQISCENLPVLVSYKLQLLQVFGNLISNSIKYRKPDQAPDIHIAAQDLNDHWLFSIRDNGIGFDMEYAEKVFVIFQRLHTRDKYQGSGIGLAIVRKVLENLNGKIWVESEENVGSTFYFTIPK